MKIKSVKPYLFNPGVGKNLLFTRVETDTGIYGWGEGYVVQGEEKLVAEYIAGMEIYLIDRDPFNIKHTGKALFNDFACRRSTGDFFAAWSSIEIALWDILGKHLGQPIYNLLGGKSRQSIRVYANGWYDVNFGKPDDQSACDRIAINPFIINNGFVELPTKPGLGIDLDMNKLLAHPYKQSKKNSPSKGWLNIMKSFHVKRIMSFMIKV